MQGGIVDNGNRHDPSKDTGVKNQPPETSDTPNSAVGDYLSYLTLGGRHTLTQVPTYLVLGENSETVTNFVGKNTKETLLSLSLTNQNCEFTSDSVIALKSGGQMRLCSLDYIYQVDATNGDKIIVKHALDKEVFLKIMDSLQSNN